MKKKLTLFLVLFFVTFASNVFAAGSCSVSRNHTRLYHGIIVQKTLLFECEGDAADGSIPDWEISADDLQYIQGWRLESVTAFPTASGTAPDAASVLIKRNGEDLLGSTDGSAASMGLNLIHATLSQTTQPFNNKDGSFRYPRIRDDDTIELSVYDQATVEADFSVLLIFTE